MDLIYQDYKSPSKQEEIYSKYTSPPISIFCRQSYMPNLKEKDYIDIAWYFQKKFRFLAQ